ncbi:hypothetical protein ULMS_24400 [Patiriisocius marinistellae]|uniref:Uncharacterized protein n=1 Tax=Patiriisocius marinistellae TaxID=2494560 RepID=A0A5J4G066_9FLAO|nr:transglutaminase domain-containing protein [Patiriisocius marinistellae]GEQ86932.1 hypothetical protein ULMS_24400 [Patiriisocius marinistellae]
MKQFLFFIFLIATLSIYAQEYKYTPVTIAQLTEQKDSLFLEADAKYILKDIEYTYGQKLRIFERIKIYTKEGFAFAKEEIGFTTIEDLEAYTYNLDEGEVKKTKVPSSSIFVEKFEDENTITKVTYPEVRVGSILEISYTIPYAGLRMIGVQSIIPIKSIRVYLKSAVLRELTITQNPLSGIVLTSEKNDDGIFYSGKNIPPLKQEKFVTNIQNYRAQIRIEQVGSYGERYMESWEEIAALYNDTGFFGKQLERKRYFEYDLPKILGDEINPLKRAKLIYAHVQDKMEWTEYYSRGSEDIKKAYKEEKGTIAEINFIVIAMMRKAGLNANPLLTATLSRGYVLSPSATIFNATICSVEIFGNTYILDASRKINAFGELSNEMINGNGLLIYKNDDWKLFPTSPTLVSKEINIVNATIDPIVKNIKGEIKTRINGYFSNRYRSNYENSMKDSYWENLEEMHNTLKIENPIITGDENVDLPITFKANFQKETYVEDINNELYFSPLFIFGNEVDEFNDTERKYPLDFRFPYHKSYKINFTIPDNYKVVSLLEPKNLAMPDGIASLKYDNNVSGNQIQISMDFEINYSLLGADYYEGIKKIFTEYFKISNAKIVLAKK